MVRAAPVPGHVRPNAAIPGDPDVSTGASGPRCPTFDRTWLGGADGIYPLRFARRLQGHEHSDRNAAARAGLLKGEQFSDRVLERSPGARAVESYESTVSGHIT